MCSSRGLDMGEEEFMRKAFFLSFFVQASTLDNGSFLLISHLPGAEISARRKSIAARR